MGTETLLGFQPHLRYCPPESPDLPFWVSVLYGSPEVLSSLGLFSPKIPCPCLGFLLLMGFQLFFVFFLFFLKRYLYYLTPATQCSVIVGWD